MHNTWEHKWFRNGPDKIFLVIFYRITGKTEFFSLRGIEPESWNFREHVCYHVKICFLKTAEKLNTDTDA
jgi:hypothetical protein